MKLLVTLLGLFGAPCRLSALPAMIRRPVVIRCVGNSGSLSPRRYVPGSAEPRLKNTGPNV